MFQLSLILTLAVSLVVGLKPSEVGVNDWAISSIGELRDVAFTKNKIYFQSHLNSIGILDKYTGKVEARAQAAESEKAVGFGDMTMNVVTRYNQVVSYFITATGLDKKSSNNFRAENRTVQWLTRFDENDYFITKSSLHHGKELIREATSDQTFLRVVQGQSVAGSIVYLLYRNNSDSTYCLESYLKGFLNKHCTDSTSQELTEIEFYQDHLILSFSHSAFLLSGSLELVSSFNQPLVQLVNGVLLLQDRAFHIKSRKTVERRPVKSARAETEVSILQGDDGLTVFRDDIEIFKIGGSRKSLVLRAWFNFKSEMDYDLLVQFSDLELVCYSVVKSKVEVSWKREESLAYIQDVVFMKYRKIDTLDNQYHRSLLSHSYRGLTLAEKLMQVPQDILLRLQEEVTDILHFVVESFDYLVLHLGNIDSSSIRKFQMPPEQEIKYGLRKYLLAATGLNTIIALDTKTKELLWKINRESGSQLVKFVHLKRDYEAEVAVVVSYSAASSETSLEEVTEEGEVRALQTLSSEHEPSVYKLNDHNIAIKLGQRIEKFSLLKTDELAEKEFYFYTQEKNVLSGWKAVGEAVVRIWNFESRGSESIIRVASAFRGEQTAHIPLFDSEKVFFKNVDFTNLAVLTSFNRTDVALYIINGRTGKIHYNSYKNSISLNMPINLVYDENNVLVSYFNHKSKNFEIWTVEQYQERIETSALNMINDYLQGNSYRPQESRERTIFEDEVYGSPVHIKHLYVSESKMSLTRRNLFIITRENKLYTIGRDFVSTRRPKKDVKSFFANEKFPEHAYFLPHLPSSYLSYYLELATLSRVVFSPTDMESTIFTLCYGTDLFLVRNAPDKTFDMITEDFNHVVLLLILIAATVGILTFKKMLTSAKLKKPHIE